MSVQGPDVRATEVLRLHAIEGASVIAEKLKLAVRQSLGRKLATLGGRTRS